METAFASPTSLGEWREACCPSSGRARCRRATEPACSPGTARTVGRTLMPARASAWRVAAFPAHIDAMGSPRRPCPGVRERRIPMPLWPYVAASKHSRELPGPEPRREGKGPRAGQLVACPERRPHAARLGAALQPSTWSQARGVGASARGLSSPPAPAARNAWRRARSPGHSLTLRGWAKHVPRPEPGGFQRSVAQRRRGKR